MASKRFPISLRELEVVAVSDISPRLRRITFGGLQMGAFTSTNGFSIPPFASEGPDDHVKMFFPHPETGILTVPTQADGHLDWPNAPRPTAREYTPRSFDPEAGTCDFEFVLHGHGIAGTWAAAARIGDRLFFAGPRASFIIPEADWYLLVGDETALPAIGNWLEMLPETAQVTALILCEDMSARIPLPAPRDAVVEWHLHDPARPTRLTDLVRAVSLPAGRGFVWGAGEREAIRLLRSHLADERGLAKSQVGLSAYWHHGVDDAMVEKAYDQLDALADLAGPFALRAAATYRLAEHVGAGATTVDALAAASGCDPHYLRPLVPILIDKAVLAGTPDALALGPLGLILRDDDHARDHLDVSAAPGRMDMAWIGLVAALGGGDGYVRAHGRSYREDAASADHAEAFADEHGHMIEEAAEEAARQIALQPGAHVVDVRGGQGTFLAAVLDRNPEATGTVVDLPAVAGLAHAVFSASDRAGAVSILSQPADAPLPGGADAYLLGGVLGRLPDDAAAAELAAVAAAMSARSRLFVLEFATPDQPHWLLWAQLSFGVPRPHDAIAALAARAGLAQLRRLPLPDGDVLFEFVLKEKVPS